MSRAELKTEAKNSLRGNWGWAIIVALVLTIINALIFGPRIKETVNILNNFNNWDSTQIASVAEPGYWSGRLIGSSSISFLSGLFMLSMAITFLNFARNRKLPFIKAIFSVFTDDRFIPEFLNYLMSYIFLYLWTLLLVIPGVIKQFSYAMTPYIVSDLVESGQRVHA
ncbi:DUF975 family protein, partial [Lactobacillus sp. XV13L]|nr:DUF975 family protein [Lactobacillus sp. XV13L]